MVLGSAVREIRRFHGALTGEISQEREDADAHPAGRRGRDGSSRPEPRAVSRTQALWSGGGARGVSAGAAWVAGRAASHRPAEADRGVVRQVSRTGSESREALSESLSR